MMLVMDGIIFFFNYLFLILMVLVSISFLTLLERKILGIVQDRKGPNKVSVGGIIQPMGDGVKLLSKEVMWIYKSNFYYYFFSPCMSFIIMLLCWLIYPYLYSYLNSNLDFLLILMVLSLGVYGIMLAGWSANSMYSMFGSIRAISQTISYEVTLVFLMVYQFFFSCSVSFKKLMEFQNGFMFMFYLFIVFLMVFIVMLAELNRTPFDLVEGESELVSGFNVEYISSTFALIFLAEYGMILFMGMMFMIMYFGCSSLGWVGLILFVYLIILLRGVLPRVRYDSLMFMGWKSVLPVSMNLLIIYLCLLVLCW
uniref:NADH-ubiquinone oxidoreductase chain 1 n=1 Tax=Evania appendigaster TaxID=27486 RepID=C8YLY6_EVAAP|nr:NADH dehydrogenase subunit 1 [Evania appendigaster]ACL36011.1 NADH dehydrogenase subunit 1 [Evania appendigaster]